ncbi:MAG: SH3 domain-containing protein [Alphaproteobacteria bacterium]
MIASSVLIFTCFAQPLLAQSLCEEPLDLTAGQSAAAVESSITGDCGLTVNVGGEGTPESMAQAPDFADGLSGGPDYWEVTDVPAGDILNVRAGPGTANEIIGALANGDIVANRGCAMVGRSRWCQIETGAEMTFTGWVSGRYLREGYPDLDQATGRLPCSTSIGQPTRPCDFRVTRGPAGFASVWVTIGEGRERFIAFREGEPITSEAGLDVRYEKSGDLYLIRMGGKERYEIPEAVVFGG